MELMIEFSTALLGAVADFLGSEPIIYFFSIICLFGICKIVRMFLPNS